MAEMPVPTAAERSRRDSADESIAADRREVDAALARFCDRYLAGHESATADASPAKHLMGRSNDRPAATSRWRDLRRLTP